jgi:hypothetical protein
MHNPTGLIPNLKIKIALTSVGVDAGVMFSPLNLRTFHAASNKRRAIII